MDSQKKECPKVELLILEELFGQAENQKIENHLHECASCKEKFSELRAFYNILFDTLQNPVSNSAFQLTSVIENGNVIIAAILLKPHILNKTHKVKHFTSEIIFTTHEIESSALDELDCIPVSCDEILIKAIQSIHTHETALFLYAENKKFYSDVTLKLNNTNVSFKSDKKGKIDVGRLDLSDFDNREIMII